MVIAIPSDEATFRNQGLENNVGTELVKFPSLSVFVT